jgi:hypothetical protein
VAWSGSGRDWVADAENRSPDISSVLNEVLSYPRDAVVGPAMTLLISSTVGRCRLKPVFAHMG